MHALCDRVCDSICVLSVFKCGNLLYADTFLPNKTITLYSGVHRYYCEFVLVWKLTMLWLLEYIEAKPQILAVSLISKLLYLKFYIVMGVTFLTELCHLERETF